MRIGYARVSTIDQNEGRQIEYFKGLGIEKYFIDKVSGKDFIRPAYQELKEFAREGDQIYIMELSRFARNLKETLNEIDYFLNKGITIDIGGIGTITKDSALQRMLLQIIGAVSEFERKRILEAQKGGIEVAKAKGVYKKPKNSKSKRIDFEQEVLPMLELGVKKREIARRLNMHYSTLYKVLKQAGVYERYVK